MIMIAKERKEKREKRKEKKKKRKRKRKKDPSFLLLGQLVDVRQEHGFVQDAFYYFKIC